LFFNHYKPKLNDTGGCIQKSYGNRTRRIYCIELPNLS
jgi:hypothetical protein